VPGPYPVPPADPLPPHTPGGYMVCARFAEFCGSIRFSATRQIPRRLQDVSGREFCLKAILQVVLRFVLSHIWRDEAAPDVGYPQSHINMQQES
jgi:hypothetical protein